MSEQGQTEVPENYRAIAQLVAGFVDDKIAEFRAEVMDKIPDINREDDPVWRTLMTHAEYMAGLQATMGGLRDAVADLQSTAGESMPEHVYKQFIRAEAERLRLIKPIRVPNPHSAPSSTTDPNTDT